MTNPAGGSIGRFRLVGRIGSGGFATVWRAYDPELASDVAVKILADNWLDRSDVRERFTEEARLLRRADSDRVVRVYDVGRLDDGRPYFVMSYADRGTLADRLSGGGLPATPALTWAAEAARGIAVLHDLGILHRDIKPSNILFTSAPGEPSGERVLVADLGLAKALAYASGFTVAAGTPGYMAPEQTTAGGGGLDERADVYALGALTYRMLTGHTVPAAGEARPPSRLGAPPAADAVVMCALARERDLRWPSSRAYAHALDTVLATGGGAAPDTDTSASAATGLSNGAGPPVAAGTGRPTTGSAYAPATGSAGGTGSAVAPPWDGPRAVPPVPRVPPGNVDTATVGGRAGSARTLAGVLRRSPRRAALVAGAVVLVVALLVAGAVVLLPRTGAGRITSEDGSLSIAVPRSWREHAPVTRTIEMDAFGQLNHNGVRLSNQPDPGNSLTARTGFTVVAARSLPTTSSSSPSDTDFTLAAPSGWNAVSTHCGDGGGVDDNQVRTEDGGTAAVRRYPATACDDKRAYAMALIRYPTFGAEIYVVGTEDMDRTAVARAVSSLRVDSDELPRP